MLHDIVLLCCRNAAEYLHRCFSALTLLVGRQEWRKVCKKWGDGGDGHCLVRMEWHNCLAVNLPLHREVQKFFSGTGSGSPGWSLKKGHKMVVVWCGGIRVHFWHLYIWLVHTIRLVYTGSAYRSPICTARIYRLYKKALFAMLFSCMAHIYG